MNQQTWDFNLRITYIHIIVCINVCYLLATTLKVGTNIYYVIHSIWPPHVSAGAIKQTWCFQEPTTSQKWSTGAILCHKKLLMTETHLSSALRKEGITWSHCTDSRFQELWQYCFQALPQSVLSSKWTRGFAFFAQVSVIRSNRSIYQLVGVKITWLHPFIIIIYTNTYKDYNMFS